LILELIATDSISQITKIGQGEGFKNNLTTFLNLLSSKILSFSNQTEKCPQFIALFLLPKSF
jgi:hypothetical protein